MVCGGDASGLSILSSGTPVTGLERPVAGIQRILYGAYRLSVVPLSCIILLWQIVPPVPALMLNGGLYIIRAVSEPQSLVKVYSVVTLGAARGWYIPFGNVSPVVGVHVALEPPVAVRCMGVPQ